MKKVFVYLACTALGALLGWYLAQPTPPRTASISNTTVAPPEDLIEHSSEFRREVVAVAPGVWVAVGYGLANSILIEGPDGLIVVDTLESVEEAEPVARAFRELSDKPLVAIIYTHNHADHIFGAAAFAQILGGDDDPAIIAHERTNAHIDRIISLYRPIISRRSMRMFGVYLDDAGLVNAGIGPRLGIREGVSLGLMRPTLTVGDRLEVNLGGANFVLEHAPGETTDQLLVWMPEQRILLPGDNLYRAFPNLYTIRGTPYRDPLDWIASLDRMRALQADHLVPSHTRPVAGADEIRAVLTDYRDAIQFIHDQTVRMINQGLTPDAIAERIRLPEHLRASPFLAEFYGTAQWSARSIFAGNLGWFDGNPTHLRPLAEADRAQRWAALTGGANALMAAAETALAVGETQWVLHLTDMLGALELDPSAVRELRAEALRRQGEAESNPNARHYYLTQAAELEGLVIPDRVGEPTDAMLRDFPLDRFFRALVTNLRAEDVLDRRQTVAFRFPDLDESWTVVLRRGIAETLPGTTAGADMQVSVDSLVFKQLLSGLRSPAATLATEFEVDGGSTLDLAQWFGLFAP